MIRSRLLAVDPSLRCTGWALFDCDSTRPTVWGLIRATGPRAFLAERLNHLHEQITALFVELELSKGDLLVCEGPAPLVLNPQSALKVEHVRGMFETIARTRGVEVPGRVNPRTVQSEVLGMRGKQLARNTVKSWARESALRLYGKEIAQSNGGEEDVSQDVVDALLIGTLAVSKVRLANLANVGLAEMFAGGRQNSRLRGQRSRMVYR